MRQPGRAGIPGRHTLALVWSIAVTVVLAMGWGAVPADALISPVTVVSGPSGGVLGVGNVSIAPDGTGGVVWRQLAGGVPHIFVSQFLDGAWSAPIQVDTGQPGPATFPAIAAGDGGRLLVVWVQPWVSESTGGNPPTTVYQLVSAQMQPGSDGFGQVVQVDPNNVGNGTGVYPSLAMAPDGDAYVVYRVVDYSYPADQPPPPGDPPQMRPGDELVDVRVAQFNGLSWNSLGAVNAFPDEVTMRQPSATNAPQIAVDQSGDALVVWQEPTIDGVARIWARRLFGQTLGDALEVSPETLYGQPVTVDADAPAVSFNDDAEADVAFRLGGGPGSPLTTPYIFVNNLLPKSLPGADSFTGAVPIDGASAVGPPSIAVVDSGEFSTGFTAAGSTDLVSGDANYLGTPQVLGPAAGDPALATLDPDGGGATAWPTVNSSGLPVLDVQQTFPDGGYQWASLSAPVSGPISDLTIGPSGFGDALIAFQQGLSSTSQVAVADVQVPPHDFDAYAPNRWVGPHRESIWWQQAQNVIGPVTYSVDVDGRIRARGLYGLGYRFSAHGLGAGVHHIRVIATDSAGEETFTPAVELMVDPTAPRVRVRRLAGNRFEVLIRDRHSGVHARASYVSFGDRTPPVRGQSSAGHTYGAPGLYLITVRCENNVGIRAVDHIWVQAK